jgi:hypothetical protein
MFYKSSYRISVDLLFSVSNVHCLSFVGDVHSWPLAKSSLFDSITTLCISHTRMNCIENFFFYCVPRPGVLEYGAQEFVNGSHPRPFPLLCSHFFSFLFCIASNSTAGCDSSWGQSRDGFRVQYIYGQDLNFFMLGNATYPLFLIPISECIMN